MTKNNSALYSAISRIEADAWSELVTELKRVERSGTAFPMSEAAGHVSTGCDCPGCKVFKAIKAWGHAFSEAKILEAAEEKRVARREGVKTKVKPLTLMQLFATGSESSCPAD